METCTSIQFLKSADLQVLYLLTPKTNSQLILQGHAKKQDDSQ